MKKINLKRGFTLIELLVVVAIIGILASVVLASLNSARSKGDDSAVKANLANARSQAEILYNNNLLYDVDATATAFATAQCANTANTMFSDATIWGQISAAASAGKGIANTLCRIPSGAQSWGVAVALETGGTINDAVFDSWCVDSGGISKGQLWTTALPTIADQLVNATGLCR